MKFYLNDYQFYYVVTEHASDELYKAIMDKYSRLDTAYYHYMDNCKDDDCGIIEYFAEQLL